MGNTFEVTGWHKAENGEYEWEFLYVGESRADAESALWNADKSIHGCVKLEWRE